MGLPTGIVAVTVIVADVIDLFEICLQNLDISLNEWAIIFFLFKIRVVCDLVFSFWLVVS